MEEIDGGKEGQRLIRNRNRRIERFEGLSISITIILSLFYYFSRGGNIKRSNEILRRWRNAAETCPPSPFAEYNAWHDEQQRSKARAVNEPLELKWTHMASSESRTWPGGYDTDTHTHDSFSSWEIWPIRALHDWKVTP